MLFKKSIPLLLLSASLFSIPLVTNAETIQQQKNKALQQNTTQFVQKSASSGWKEIENKWYYFDSSGVMLKGWQSINGYWFYLNPTNGDMLTGWQSINGSWYYLNPQGGGMLTNWQEIGNKWYYFDSSGVMLKDWQFINGYWFYLNPTNGDMLTGWQSINGSWYYLNPQGGGLITNTSLKIDGKWYVFHEKGHLTNETKKKSISSSFTTFDDPDLGMKKNKLYKPQTVNVLTTKNINGYEWSLINIDSENKWISIQAENEYNEKRKELRKELNYNEYNIGPDKTPKQKANQVRAALKSQGLDTKYEVVRIPTKEEQKEFLKKQAEKQKSSQKSFAQSARTSSSWDIPNDWVHKGDIVITPDANYGITGHSGIIAKDFTETQNESGLYKDEYLLVHAPGTSANPAIQRMPLSKWEFIHEGNEDYSNFIYLRYKDKGAAFKAADYAYNTYYKDGSSYKYDIFSTSAKYNDYKTYCSKLVYLSYRDGAGVDLLPFSSFYIVHPYDFLQAEVFHRGLVPYFYGKGGYWWG
ncbi:hypothetical protein CON70_05505 [Bacillus pseudomycoides]|uniref:hypothetical protein n=1 Tax=Bacillus pseudomycoides TaxID=64104 RepID=UPI000BEC5E84|nr:hypothetical protein [Bacillus pseudomycoides]PDZ12581.1 hypothetical protein CON70_05505 [Bacillus pseudomycoides]